MIECIRDTAAKNNHSIFAHNHHEHGAVFYPHTRMQKRYYLHAGIVCSGTKQTVSGLTHFHYKMLPRYTVSHERTLKKTSPTCPCVRYMVLYLNGERQCRSKTSQRALSVNGSYTVGGYGRRAGTCVRILEQGANTN